MEFRVEFKPAEPGEIWASVAGIPALRERGATQEEALARLLPTLKAHLQARITCIQVFLEDDAPPEPMPPGLPSDKLRTLAKRYPPPASWYEEAPDVL